MSLRRKTEPRHTNRRSRFDRSLALTLFTGLALLLILGLVFSVAYGSQQITSQAEALHNADEVLRAATVARAQIALAVHMSSVDRVLGTNSSASVALSISEATQALDDLMAGVTRLYDSGTVPDGHLQSASDVFASNGAGIVTLLEDNEPVAAQQAMEGALATDFDLLTAALVDLRDELAASVAASDAALGRIGNIARFLVAFLIPAIVIFIYRELLRRQQRQIDLESRLENERALNTAREKFIANVSHELRTPLTSILGLSVLLSEDPVIRRVPASAELIEMIVSESDDLARMVEDLLITARLDAGALHYVLQETDIEREIRESVEVMRRGGPDPGLDCVPGVVIADRFRFRQVIRNLLSNARKYGGPNVQVIGRIEGNTYVCDVVDDGPGVPAELEPRLFKRFIHQGHMTATKDSVGLGLSIVNALTQGMGGSISYQRVDSQTHFMVRLPLAAADTPAALTNKSSSRADTGAPRHSPSKAG